MCSYQCEQRITCHNTQLACCHDIDAGLKRTRPYTPRTNGKVERFNGTLAREWAYVREYESEAARRAALVDFLNHYNYHRPHASLGHKPPASRVPLATYRLTAEGITDVELPKRPNEQLDLFDDE
ncbi:transposase [Mycobacteroides abscessus]|nr:transposase [Mycobacteroides abscessus]